MPCTSSKVVPDTVGTKVDASQFGVRIRCAPRLQSSTCHQGPHARMRSRGRLASPLAVRADNYEIHPQKRAEDHRKIGATLSGISDQTSVSFCDLLWMHCRLARRQNMRRIESHHSDTTTQRRLFAVLAPRESKTKIRLTTDFTDERNTNSTIRAIGVIRGSSLRGPVLVVQI